MLPPKLEANRSPNCSYHKMAGMIPFLQCDNDFSLPAVVLMSVDVVKGGHRMYEVIKGLLSLDFGVGGSRRNQCLTRSRNTPLPVVQTIQTRFAEFELNWRSGYDLHLKVMAIDLVTEDDRSFGSRVWGGMATLSNTCVLWCGISIANMKLLPSLGLNANTISFNCLESTLQIIVSQLKAVVFVFSAAEKLIDGIWVIVFCRDSSCLIYKSKHATHNYITISV